MDNDEKCRAEYKDQILRDLMKSAESFSDAEQRAEQKVEIYLSEIDEPATLEEGKNILEELKKQKAIKEYSKLEEKEIFPKKGNSKPSVFAVERSPEILNNYEYYNSIEEATIDDHPIHMVVTNIEYCPKDFIKYLRKKQIISLKNVGGEKIKKITIIKMKDGKKLIAVNDNLAETKEIKDYSEWWQIFIKETEERNMRPETRSNVKTISKDMADYFNYNTQKCPIYMGGKYKPTEIFTGRGDDAKLNPDIKTEPITEKQYLIRRKRKTKK